VNVDLISVDDDVAVSINQVGISLSNRSLATLGKLRCTSSMRLAIPRLTRSSSAWKRLIYGWRWLSSRGLTTCTPRTHCRWTGSWQLRQLRWIGECCRTRY